MKNDDGLWFVAPNGYKALEAGKSYFLLCSDPVNLRAVLVTFVDKPYGYRLAILTRDDFEAGLRPILPSNEACLQTVKDPDKLPSRLSALKDKQPDLMKEMVLPRKSKSGKEMPSHAEHVDTRVKHIWTAVKKATALLSEPDIDRALNRLASQCKPPQQEGRYRLWFYLYLAFNRNRWALLPPMFDAGKWVRTAPERNGKKFGRPGEHLGAMFGHGRTEDMATKIVEGFRKHAKTSRTLSEVWASIAIAKFGCKPTKGNKKLGIKAGVYHPSGKAFPSPGQVRYQCELKLGRDEYRRMLYGEQRTRSADDGIVGTYSESLVNLLERASFDSRHVRELPKGYLTGTVLPPLCVVDLIEGISSRNFGIGFSLGSEDAQSYKSALFCAAIPKSKFGEIIGMPISDEEFPGRGLPMSLVHDRGPGAAAELRQAVAPFGIELEMVPSYTPQSNPAESKHPKHRKKSGAPEHFASNLTPIQLMKREIERAMLQNRSDSALARATPRMVVQGVQPPDDVWNHLYGLRRVSLVQITFEQAVRAFLQAVEFNVVAGRLSLHGLPYNSQALMRTTLPRLMRKVPSLKPKGFVYPLAVRKAWVDVDGQLIEVDAKLAFQAGDQELDITLPELVIYDKQRSESTGSLVAHKPLEVAATFDSFTKTTGKNWNDGTIRTGRAKTKSVEAQAEMGQIKHREPQT